MSDSQEKECYGTMFPDALHFIDNKPNSGKVFKFELDKAGYGTGPGQRSDRKIEVDIDEWRDCIQCPAFEHCYKLCMAQMELACAIASQ